jgi:ubiquinone/menaquinone biosynthesis C-methylase UbiE
MGGGMNNQSFHSSAFRTFEHDGWEKAVHPYHRYFSDLTNQAIDPLLEAIQVRRGMRVLDVATGPGYGAARATEAGAQAIGVDFSAAMVAEARRLHPTLEFTEGDAEALPFPEGSFEGVVINFGLLHFSRPEQALSEAFRVLVSGGRIGFTVWAKPEVAVGFGIVLDAIQTYGNIHAPLPPGPPFFRFSYAHECRATLQAAGFRAPRVVQVPQVWKIHAPDTLFEAFFEGTARTGPLLRAQTSEALNVIHTAIQDATKAYQRDGIITLPMPAVLAAAVKP